MKICFVPIDNRPVCYTLAKDICAIDDDVELLIPPRDFLGDLNKSAEINKLLNWLENISGAEAIIISLDTLVYGGLIPSRRSNETLNELKQRLKKIKKILTEKQAKIYAFSSIMRISNNNYNEEEKEYWKDYGKKIFKYSFNLCKNGFAEPDVPDEILKDYLNTRERNFEVNKIYLEWYKEGLFDTLIFSKDDCAEYGFNVKEAKELERLGGKTKTGADEIPLSLLSRAIKKDIKVFVEYTEPEYKDRISNYEDVSIEKSVLGQLDLGGFTTVNSKNEADIVLLVNNFIEKQGELVMGWDTEPYKKILKLPQKPYAIADVRYANGGDNAFVEQLLSNITPLPPSGTSPTSGEDAICPPCGERICGRNEIPDSEEIERSRTEGSKSETFRAWSKSKTNATQWQKGVNHQYYAPYIKEFVRELRQNMTPQEVKIWQRIRKKQLGVKFRRQYQINSKYIADFVCLENKLIIEIDGGQHCESFNDTMRTFYLKNLGFRIIRFWNNEVDKNLEGCIEFLKRIITPLPSSGTSPAGGEDAICPPCGENATQWQKGVNPLLEKLYGYAGWNTSANTLGTILATIKLKWQAQEYNESAFKKLQMTRFLDDWAYQANVRGQIDKPCDIKEKMKPYEERLTKIFDCNSQENYIYPWNRKFEIEIVFK